MAAATTLTPAELRTRLHRLLSHAIQRVDDIDRVPDDAIEYPPTSDILDELNRVDELLYELGREQRQQREREESMQHRAAARARTPSLEASALRLDAAVQRLIEMHGATDTPVALGVRVGLHLSPFLGYLLQFCDHFPPGAYDHAWLKAARDPRVAQLADVLRSHRLEITRNPPASDEVTL